MKYYQLTIKPKSNFATLPMSDTIFGQVCCMLAEMGEDVDKILKTYDTEPFAVFSDFCINGLGNAYYTEKGRLSGKKQDKLSTLSARKEEKKSNLLLLDKLFSGITEKHALPPGCISHLETVHNSISRETGSTSDDGVNAPYSSLETVYSDSVFFYLYIYVIDDMYQKVIDAIINMGKLGFGKDASVGKGRYEVLKVESIKIEDTNYNAVYTLGNCILDKVVCSYAYYDVFTRFGRHGAVATFKTGNPFKDPIVMAKQGALIFTDKKFTKAYIGSGVIKETYAHQGYSLYIPLKLERGQNV